MESFPSPQKPELELHKTVDSLGREQHFLINAEGKKERISNDEYEDFLPRAVVSQSGLEGGKDTAKAATKEAEQNAAPDVAPEELNEWQQMSDDELYNRALELHEKLHDLRSEGRSAEAKRSLYRAEISAINEEASVRGLDLSEPATEDDAKPASKDIELRPPEKLALMPAPNAEASNENSDPLPPPTGQPVDPQEMFNKTVIEGLRKKDGTNYTYIEAVEKYNEKLAGVRNLETEGRSKEEIHAEFIDLVSDVYELERHLSLTEGVSEDERTKRRQLLDYLFNRAKMEKIQGIGPAENTAEGGTTEAAFNPPSTPIQEAPALTKNPELAKLHGEMYTLLLNKIEEAISRIGRDRILQKSENKEKYLNDLLKLNQATLQESLYANGNDTEVEQDMKDVFLNPNSVVFKIGVRHEELVEAGILHIMIADPTQLNSEQRREQNAGDLKALYALVAKEKTEQLTEKEQHVKDMLYGRIFTQNSFEIFEGKSRDDFSAEEKARREEILDRQMGSLDALRDGKAKVVEDENGGFSIVMLTPVELAGYGTYEDTGVVVSEGKELADTALALKTDPMNIKGQKKKFSLKRKKGANKTPAPIDLDSKRQEKGGKKRKLAMLGAAAVGAIGLGLVVGDEMSDKPDSQEIAQGEDGVVSSPDPETSPENPNYDPATVSEGTDAGVSNPEETEASIDVAETEEYKALEEKYDEDIQRLQDKVDELTGVLESTQAPEGDDSSEEGGSGNSGTSTESEERANEPVETGVVEDQQEQSGAETNEPVAVSSEQTDNSDIVSALRQEDLSQAGLPWNWAQAHNFNLRQMVADAQAKGFNFSWNLQSSSDRDDILLYNGSDNAQDVINGLIDSLES